MFVGVEFLAICSNNPGVTVFVCVCIYVCKFSH